MNADEEGDGANAENLNAPAELNRQAARSAKVRKGE
jgi:hypothetical protein